MLTTATHSIPATPTETWIAWQSLDTLRYTLALYNRRKHLALSKDRAAIVREITRRTV